MRRINESGTVSGVPGDDTGGLVEPFGFSEEPLSNESEVSESDYDASAKTVIYQRSKWSKYLAGTSVAFPAQLPRR